MKPCFQRQRRCVPKPRVAESARLPWVIRCVFPQPQRGCGTTPRIGRAPAWPELITDLDIAEVLTDMDAELAALAQRREKTRVLKQAMMQELLTGRTRLI